MKRSFHRSLLILGVCFAWALTSLTPIWKYLSHGKAAAAGVLGVSSIAFGMDWLGRLNRKGRQIHSGWFGVLFLVLIAAFAVLYPISLRHTLNSGSDREDALRIELQAVQHRQYPYDARTFRGNPPTPLPGAMLLAAPFFAVGHIAWQNFVWVAFFFWFAIRFFRFRATALFFLTIFLLFAPGNLSDFTSGGDYLTNLFYFAVAVIVFLKALNGRWPFAIFSALFLGVTLSSRPIYGVMLIPLLAMVLQGASRVRAAVLFCTIVAAAVAVTLPVLSPHPFAHLAMQLNQNAGKLRYLPSGLHARWTLPLLAVMVSCVAFFIRMDLPRFFLLFSVTTFVMLAPFVASFAVYSEKLWYNFFYLSVCSLSFSLWALSRYEGLSGAEANVVATDVGGA